MHAPMSRCSFAWLKIWRSGTRLSATSAVKSASTPCASYLSAWAVKLRACANCSLRARRSWPARESTWNHMRISSIGSSGPVCPSRASALCCLLPKRGASRRATYSSSSKNCLRSEIRKPLKPSYCNMPHVFVKKIPKRDARHLLVLGRWPNSTAVPALPSWTERCASSARK